MTQTEIDRLKSLAKKHVDTGKWPLFYGPNKVKKAEAIKLFYQFVDEEKQRRKAKEDK